MAILDAIPDWQEYAALSTSAREKLTKEIGRETGMKWRRMKSFSRWGQKLKTAVYQAADASFVFIPGREVTLGWRGLPEGKNDEEKEFLKALSEDVQEYWNGQFEPEKIIGLLTTPMRTVSIPPMLVEQRPRPFEDGQPVSLNELELSDSCRQAIEQFQSGSQRCLVLDTFQPGNPKLRLTRKENGDILAEIVIPATVENLQKQLESEGFSLPDGDIWEYLSGGENGALFAWGNRLPREDELGWSGKPNGFGLHIGYDSEGYHMEIIKDSLWPFRGGDGGEIACYGDMQVLNELVGSPHFVSWYGHEWTEDVMEEIGMLLEEGLDGFYDYYRRIRLL
ncbi:hypothetical protein AALA36_22435 [Lachnospiraceae bacterium 66-29]